jgi:two-component system CheB/CheR fusion protein
MPRSALATGLVDYELAPAEMPAQLIAYASHAFGQRAGEAAVEGPGAKALKKIVDSAARADRSRLFAIQAEHHPAPYRTAHGSAPDQSAGQLRQLSAADAARGGGAVSRPVDRRDQFLPRSGGLHGAGEADHSPTLFADQPAGAVIRVWSAGCSTGEEAYSLAILLQEHLETLKGAITAQVFATDIDSRAIATARSRSVSGQHRRRPVAGAAGALLHRHTDGSAYRIHKGIRDMLVFSEQDVIKDPPFSRLDLISCRNLLIYMGAELQKKLIPLVPLCAQAGWHTVPRHLRRRWRLADLFAVLDRKPSCISARSIFPAPAHDPGSLSATADGGDRGGCSAGKSGARARLPLRELTEQALLQQLAPAGALVNGQGDILYLHGRTGMYLEPAPGESGINNILRMAREGLRQDLRMALHKAASSGERVRCPGLQVKTNSHFTRVDLTVCPLAADPDLMPESPLYLVMLQEAVADPDQAPPAGRAASAACSRS